MDNNNNSYFYLGGFLSFLMLLLVFVFFSYTLLFVDVNKSYALLKDKAIQISLVSDLPSPNIETKRDEFQAVEVPKELEVTNAETNDIPLQTKIVESAQKVEKVEKVEKQAVSKLFSHVVTQNTNMNKVDDAPQIDEKKLLQLTQKTNMASRNSVASIKQKIDATKFSKASVQVTTQNTSTGEEINKYLAKIQGHIYENFFPQLSTQGQSARIIVKLAADGTVLDFKIVSYSANELFNVEVERLKTRILRIKFPQNPDGKSGNYMIRLVAKD